MMIEGNNVEAYLWAAISQNDGLDLPLTDIIQLYEEHAPSFVAPGYRPTEAIGTTNIRGRMEHFLRDGRDIWYFDTQMGLYGFRNRRLDTLMNPDLTGRERDERISNLYRNMQHQEGPI
eukprot:Skav230946  [mRNA]  locus=scaffold3010:29097:29453:- [translate_table: standard]